MRTLICFCILTAVVFSGRPTPTIIRTPSTTTTTTPSPTTTPDFKLPPILLNQTWECGTDEFTKAISEGEIVAKCPKLRDHVNSCCLAHDQCYVDQSGQKYCDDSFCHCLNKRTSSSKSCHDESSPLFCDLVRSFGDDAYKNSGPNATTTAENLVEKDDYDYESQIKNASLALN